MSALDKLEKVVSLPSSDRLTLNPIVPDGEYLFRVLTYATCIKFGEARLEVKCSIIDGEYFGTNLSRWYCLDGLKGKPGDKGKFIPKKTGDFLIEYCKIFPLQRITRLDRIPMDNIFNLVIRARTRTVDKNNQQKKLPNQLQHSVIAEFLKAEV